MKKTSKKLLSLFLAVVMIITSCSVGFTAFGAEPKQDSYWSSGSDAEAAFDSLNDLVDTYLPQLLQIETIKNLLEDNLGMTVTEETSISDIVQGASPLLIGVLGKLVDEGNYASKEAIRGDSSPLADMYYAYLDDSNAPMDFYALYNFCKANKGKGGDVGAYADAAFPVLKELLDTYGDYNKTFNDGVTYGNNVIDQYSSTIGGAAGANYNYNMRYVPLQLIEQLSLDGSHTLKEMPIDRFEPIFYYLKGIAEAAKTNVEINNLADVVYYSDSGRGYYQYHAEVALGVALMSGMPITIDGKEITMNNYAEVISSIFTIEDYANQEGVSLSSMNASKRALFEDEYKYIGICNYLLEKLAPSDLAYDSTYFYESALGTLIYAGLVKDVEKDIKSLEITDAQIDSFIQYATTKFSKITDIKEFESYITSSDCPFSSEVKEFFSKALTINGGSLKTYFVNFQALAIAGNKQGLLDYKIDFGIPAYEGKTVIEAANLSIPSIILNHKATNPSDFVVNNTIKTFKLIANYNVNISSATAEVQYKFANFAEMGGVKFEDISVEYVNSIIDGLLDKYLNNPLDLAGMQLNIGEIITSLIDSDVVLYNNAGTGVLNDLWLNLHDAPIETVFTLLPVLVIVVDEVLLPLLLNESSESEIYNLLTNPESPIGFLFSMSQKAGAEKPYVGIGSLNFNLNKALPAILHWITGDTDKAYQLLDTYDSAGADAEFYNTLKEYCDNGKDEEGNRLTYDGGFNEIPKFINIYAADKAIYKFQLDSLEQTFINGDMDPALAKGLTETITELANFAKKAVDEYIKEHGNDPRYNLADENNEATVTQVGLNNVFVAVPQIIDIMGKNFIKKYKIDSDWTYTYEGKIVTVEKKFSNGTFTQYKNATLQDFKDSSKDGADAVLGSFVNILIGNWINALLDFVNDTVEDKDNTISKDLKIVDDLLNALGGFGEKSIITDLVNGFFGLTRKDTASFTLQKNEATGFNGFSNESGFFLLANIQYDDNGTAKGIVPFIMSLINNGKKEETSSLNLTSLLASAVVEESASFAPLASSKKSAVGTDYSELLTKENIATADKLVSKLDSVLSSLLKNTSLNEFTATSTDSLLSAAVSTVSNVIGPNNSEALLDLVDAYLECIVGENNEGPIDAKKVYTSKNLSNLVVETYSLVESIADSLLSGIDANGIIADAICGIISPDSVGIRMSEDFGDTAKMLLDGHTTWTDFAGKDLKFGFSAGDKATFYDGLGESLNGVATVVGFLLTSIASTDGENIYSAIVYPVVNNLAKATKAGDVMTPAAFNDATDAQKLIKGIITPVSNILAKLYDAPATFIVNLVQGLAGVLDDAQLNAILNGINAIAGGVIDGTLDGVYDLVKNLSPTLSAYLKATIDKALSGVKVKDQAVFPINLQKLLGIGSKDVVVSLINGLLPESISSMIQLKSIDWKKLSTAKTAGEALVLVLGYAGDLVLSSSLLTDLIDSLDANLAAIIKNLSTADLLSVISEVLEVATTPTEIYWTFSQYAGKITNTFIYPTGVSAEDADNAVERLDSLVENIFPLLEMFGVNIGGDLSSLVNDNLFTNANLTKLATLIYGSLESVVSDATVAEILGTIGIDLSTKGVANILMDKSYGATFSSAAATLKKAKSWKDVKSLNWGFKDGSKAAQAGFVSGLAAILRPINFVFRVLLAGEKINPAQLKELKPTLVSLIKTLSVGETALGDAAVLTISKGMLKIVIKGDKESVAKVNLANVVSDAIDNLLNVDLYIGSNAYESAIVPILEAFMCDGVKTYKQYKADIAKAKDNVLIDVLTPIVGLVNKVVEKPFSTITGILPNVAYFINSNGLMQAISNLLAPITSQKGILGALEKNGLNIDKIIESALGKSLSKVITDAIGIKADFNLELSHLEKCNIHVIVVPLVNMLLKDLGIKIPEIDFAKLASLGTITKFQSAARNDKGNFDGQRVVANKGQVLITVLRYIAQVINENATAIQKLLGGIDAIKKNDTIKNIINLVFGQLKVASKDDLVRAILYFFEGHQQDSFFDYSGFKYNDTNDFEWGDLDSAFCETLPPMLDGLVSGLLEEKGGLLGLIGGLIYKDEIISKLATGLYGAIEGVKVGDMGSLATLLAKTGIDFTTANVAALLTDEAYGTKYEANAAKIKAAGSWSKVNADSLSWGVTDRDSFVNALCAVLRPIYGVLDVLINDGYLNLFDLVAVPGSDGYTSTIVPLLEAFSCYNIKTQYQYREDMSKEYDAILKDVLNPLLDKVEDLLNAPIEILASMLPNLSLFFANDGLLQIIDNLLTPVSALLGAIQPILDVNKLLDALGVDLNALIAKAGLKLNINLDIYDLKGTLQPLIGADNVVGLLNTILGIIKIGGKPLGLVLPEIDWLKLAAHGDIITNGSSAVATIGPRVYVVADSAEQEAETLIAVLRFVINTVNYQNNYQTIVDLVGGLIGGGEEGGITDVIGEVLGMLQGDADEVIVSLVDLLKSFS